MGIESPAREAIKGSRQRRFDAGNVFVPERERD
jgi:hypothetical protein